MTSTTAQKRSKRTTHVEKPSDAAACWPTVGKSAPARLILSRTNEQWRNQALQLEQWLESGQLDDHPMPVIQVTDSIGSLRGMIHLRCIDSKVELNLSLMNRRDIWQTGAWLPINLGDEVSVAWCTNMSGTELSAIMLEIKPRSVH